MTKKEIRKIMKARIASMSETERAGLSCALFAKVEAMPEFKKARRVLAYWSLPDEPNSHEILSRWMAQKEILLPAVVGDDLELRRYAGDDDLAVGAFNIKEPVGEIFTDFDKVDLVIVPGLAFDAAGYRLGRGKGYYDRLLPRLKSAVTLGFCFPCQFEECLPHDEWDIPMDTILCQV